LLAGVVTFGVHDCKVLEMVAASSFSKVNGWQLGAIAVEPLVDAVGVNEG